MKNINPEKFQGKFRISSHRLKGYDYSQNGAYFITICTKYREHFFGEIIDGKMILNELGKIALEEWNKTAEIRTGVILDEFVIMPNHVHGIIILNNDLLCRDTVHRVSSGQMEKFGKPTSNSIPTIIRSYKSAVSRNIRKFAPEFYWQSNYHDRITRNENELERIRQYIGHNPENWENDENNIPLEKV